MRKRPLLHSQQFLIIPMPSHMDVHQFLLVKEDSQYSIYRSIFPHSTEEPARFFSSKPNAGQGLFTVATSSNLLRSIHLASTMWNE